MDFGQKYLIDIFLHYSESPEARKDVAGGHGEEVFHPGCGIEEADFQLTSSFRLVASEGEFQIFISDP